MNLGKEVELRCMGICVTQVMLVLITNFLPGVHLFYAMCDFPIVILCKSLIEANIIKLSVGFCSVVYSTHDYYSRTLVGRSGDNFWECA